MLKPHSHNALRKPYPILALKVGPLYKCVSHHLITISDEKYIDKVFSCGPYKHRKAAERSAFFWTEQLSCKVSCLPKEEPFMLIEKNGRFAKVLSGSAFGWVMLTKEDLVIEKVK